MAENRIPVAAVVGPTATGKTELGIGLCQRLGGEVVSCDSMQVYRGLPIGTAQPTPEELLLRQERQAAVNRALTRLSPDEQTLFYRKYYYLQPTAQIAAELGTTERAVEGRLYRLKKRLRKLLGGEGYAGP